VDSSITLCSHYQADLDVVRIICNLTSSFHAYANSQSFPQDVLRERPIVLYRVDRHASWVSQKVLDLLDPLPDKVEGGEIVRNAEGQPTGIRQLFATHFSVVTDHLGWLRRFHRQRNAAYWYVHLAMITPTRRSSKADFSEAIKPVWNDEEMLPFFQTAMADAVQFGLTSSVLKCSTYVIHSR